MDAAVVVKKVVRPAVVQYSIRNRRRKARSIRAFMAEHGCTTVLLVGTNGDRPHVANGDVVERAVVVGHTVRMGINIRPVDSPYPFTVANGCDMPFDDDYVDFSLANAIIEHVGDEDEQRRFVAEQTRVARCWVITTPNRWFPVEPHTSVLFLHWMPACRAGRKEFSRLMSRREFTDLLPPGTRVTGHWWSPTFSAYFAR
ncbi:methyltransferase domain-containing protein [uncultured Cellulomonas sp.]|uniref:methyltransferase domain-containing protein n=1 Tax=uncultured Cellulomonas sp. TaxID=189682 RepID=UPI00262FAA9F|nr:methyltransferase domain-containing protein [uncultured Cellulomonas sp.]